MQNTLTSQKQATHICKSRSALMFLICCVLPFSFIYIGFSAVSIEQAALWQNMQYHLILIGFASLAFNYWMLLFKPNYILHILVKEK